MQTQTQTAGTGTVALLHPLTRSQMLSHWRATGNASALHTMQELEADDYERKHPDSDPPECLRCGMTVWGLHTQCSSEWGYCR